MVPGTHLPPRQALFGRDDELQLLKERLESGARLITITGPAGTGKTALLAELGHHRALEAVFVDLTAARDAVDVCRAVGIALFASLGGGDPVDGIAAALRRRGPAPPRTPWACGTSPRRTSARW